MENIITFEDRIRNEVAGDDGFYKRSNAERFIQEGLYLRTRYALSEDEIVDLLTELYSAVADEYGE